MKYFFTKIGLFVLGIFSTITPVNSQSIRTDGTTDSQLTPTENGIRIDNGNRLGGNLFHSFEEFSVPTNGEAFFNNDLSVTNIFNRVTGGSISNIDGLIRANGTANVFLLNPNGIIFGENATLNIGGSFLGTTADSIIFPDGEFTALDSNNPPLITINAPIGLNLRDNPADIINQANLVREERFGESQIPLIFPNFNRAIPFNEKIVKTLVGLEVNRDRDITLVGGNIILDGGGLSALGGKVQLGGLAESGIIEIDPNGNLIFPENLVLGDVQLINDASIDVQGNGGGDIIITGQNIEVKDGSSLFAGIRPFEGSPNTKAGDIVINGIDRVIFDGFRGENTVRGGSGFNTVISNEVGRGLEKEELNTESELVFFGQFDFLINGQGEGGNIEINTKNLDITNRAIIRNVIYGMGDTGNIIINAESEVNIQNSGSSIFNTIFTGEGNTGNIAITTQSLNLTDGAVISENNFRGMGDLGKIIITAKENVSLDGTSSNPQLPTNRSEIFNVINPDGTGDGGIIEINTKNLSLNNEGSLFTSLTGIGNAGNVNINAEENIDIINGGKISSGVEISFFLDEGKIKIPEGDGGTITINSNNLKLENEGTITVSSEGIGNVGQIIINTSSLELSDRSKIEAETNFNDSNVERSRLNSTEPNIEINVIDGNLILKGKDNLISARAIEEANGGNIKIDTDFIIASPANNDILADTELGQGGNIDINVERGVLGEFQINQRSDRNSREDLIENSINDINATGGLPSLDGEVVINFTDIGIIQDLATLDTNTIDRQTTLTDRCEIERNLAEKQNSLTINKLSGKPYNPDESFSSEDIITVPKKDDRISLQQTQEPIVINNTVLARGMVKNPDGSISLVAYSTSNNDRRPLNNSFNCNL